LNTFLSLSQSVKRKDAVAVSGRMKLLHPKAIDNCWAERAFEVTLISGIIGRLAAMVSAVCPELVAATMALALILEDKVIMASAIASSLDPARVSSWKTGFRGEFSWV